MAVARPLLLRIQNPLGCEVHLGQELETCQNDLDPSPCPFLLLANLQKNRHLSIFVKNICFYCALPVFCYEISKMLGFTSIVICKHQFKVFMAIQNEWNKTICMKSPTVTGYIEGRGLE